MKRLLATVLLLMLVPLCALAHPGRTDSRGGHYNRSTGEYHYHHGYSAHDHPGGVCPYAAKATPTPTKKTPSVISGIRSQLDNSMPGMVVTLSPYQDFLRTSTPAPTAAKDSIKIEPEKYWQAGFGLLMFGIVFGPLLTQKRRKKNQEDAPYVPVRRDPPPVVPVVQENPKDKPPEVQVQNNLQININDPVIIYKPVVIHQDPPKQKELESPIFYVGMNGTRYHKPGCYYAPENPPPHHVFRSEKIVQMRGYTPCKICLGNRKKVDIIAKEKNIEDR